MFEKTHESSFIFSETNYIELESWNYKNPTSIFLRKLLIVIFLFLLFNNLFHYVLIIKFTKMATLDENLFIRLMANLTCYSTFSSAV